MEDSPFDAVEEDVHVDVLFGDGHVVADEGAELLHLGGIEQREIESPLIELGDEGLGAGGVGHCGKQGGHGLLQSGVGRLEAIYGHLHEAVDADVALGVGTRKEVESATLLSDGPDGIGGLDVAVGE